MTFSSFSGQLVSDSGFVQKVPDPSNPTSNKSASYHSVRHDATVALAHGDTAHTVVLPKGALLVGISLIVETAFNGTTPTVKIGSAASGADILDAKALTASDQFFPLLTKIPGSSADDQTLFVTVSDADATAGAATLVVSYLNPSDGPLD